jgi:hypothetical protein
LRKLRALIRQRVLSRVKNLPELLPVHFLL